jgi:anti-sigma regulatory factor (Ser/Thr protein kinase)
VVEFRAQFRGTPSSVREARWAIVDYARACGFTADESFEIALGAGEALANAIEHGCQNAGSMSVACTFEADLLTIEITDSGTGFDHRSLAQKERDPNGLRGFGLHIMRAVMDDITYMANGQSIRLTKRRA